MPSKSKCFASILLNKDKKKLLKAAGECNFLSLVEKDRHRAFASLFEKVDLHVKWSKMQRSKRVTYQGRIKKFILKHKDDLPKTRSNETPTNKLKVNKESIESQVENDTVANNLDEVEILTHESNENILSCSKTSQLNNDGSLPAKQNSHEVTIIVDGEEPLEESTSIQPAKKSLKRKKKKADKSPRKRKKVDNFSVTKQKIDIKSIVWQPSCQNAENDGMFGMIDYSNSNKQSCTFNPEANESLSATQDESECYHDVTIIEDGWKEKYFAMNTRFDELTVLLAEKDEELKEKEKQNNDITIELSEAKTKCAEKFMQLVDAKEQIFEMSRLLCKEKLKQKELAREHKLENDKLKKELANCKERLKEYEANNEAQEIEVVYNEEVISTDDNTTYENQIEYNVDNEVFSQSPLKQKSVHKSKISQLFDNESKLIDTFVEAGFINTIEKQDLNFAIKKLFKRLFNKSPTKMQIEIIKKKWIQNEDKYRILIGYAKNKKAQSKGQLQASSSNRTVILQSPPKQKKNNKSKLSQLFSEQGRLIDFFVQVDFVSLVDKHGLIDAIKHFFNVLYKKTPTKDNMDFFIKKWLKNEYQYRYLVEHRLKNSMESTNSSHENESNSESWKRRFRQLEQEMSEMKKVMASLMQRKC